MCSVLSGFQGWKKSQDYLSCAVNVLYSSASGAFKQRGSERRSFGRNV